MDMTLIDSVVKALNNQGIDTILAYQTTIPNSNTILKCSTADTITSMTYIIWNTDSLTYIVPVSECAIYKNWVIDGNPILSFTDLDSVWIRKNEEPIYLLDNLHTPYLLQIAYLYTPNQTRVMELGSNSEYLLNPDLEKYRQDFIKLVNKKLNLKNQHYYIDQIHERYGDYRMNKF